MVGEIDLILFDKNDDPSRGQIKYLPVAPQSPGFTWPIATVPLTLGWSGNILVPQTVEVPSGITLKVDPGSLIQFGKDVSMHVHGSLQGIGAKDQRITFTSLLGKEPENQVLLLQ